jgi:predicted nucleotide-binding protein
MSTATRHAGRGVEALRRAKRKWPKSRLVLITGMPSLDAQKWCGENDVTYLVKPIGTGTLERLLGVRNLRAFVVHGRNEKDRKKAVSALQKTNIEPVVLMLQPARGRTVIEKFEAVSDTCDAAVVVWSPDDFGGLMKTMKKAQHRARQNVVFELGYFYGALRRRSGRVVILEFGETELPSDISGIIRIDATKPIRDISSELKKEFGHLLD